MNLLPNEKVLLRSDEEDLVLTTHRVRYQAKAWRNVEIRSIMLDELASCALTRSKNTMFLVAAALSLIFGDAVIAAGSGKVLAALLVLAYFTNRRQILALASAGTRISFDIEGMAPETVVQFIERAEAAKNSRYLIGREQAKP